MKNNGTEEFVLIILEDTVWSGNQTITLTDDIQIAQGVTLTIQPNVRVIGNGHEILAFGTLYAGQSGTDWRVKFSNVNFQFGNDYSDPGRIELYNADIKGGSFLDANGHAHYGSFQVHSSSFDGTDGFYIWYPTSESEFWGNTFSNSQGLSIGTRNVVNVENNAFHNSSSPYHGQATIVSWASYGADDNIRVIDNTFYQGASYVLEVADGYTSAHLFASGNFIEAANGSGGERFVLDNQDSLTRGSDISLGVEATEPHPETPSINRPPSGNVSIAGATQEGEVLTAQTGSIVDPDGVGDFHFQWLRDGQEIDGETVSNYTLTQADVGSEISLLVSYTDEQGTPETVTSGATSPIVGDLVLIGNGQDNALIGGSFNDRLVGRAGDDSLSGNQGEDILLGGLGADTAAGGAGADTLKGNGGSDRLVGNGGNDLVLGGGGRDSLLGGDGNDKLSGGSGHDLLHGQRGHDEVTGGGGRDTFVFSRGDGADTITDFELGSDHIQIGRGASRSGQLDFEQVGDDVLVSFRNVEITVEDTSVDDLALGGHFLFV